ncbi:MAG: hypothetical protein JW900_01015 [Anaerolineae bacterium]|nr:hypothetical protein [Anaerolineae bacterium]
MHPPYPRITNRLFLALILAVGALYATGAPLLFAAPLAEMPQGWLARVPLAYPPDPTADIAWSAGYGGVADIETAFNHARGVENSQLGLSIPMLTLPSQAEWDSKTDGEKALWLINCERVDRGVHPLHGVETNVTSVAQYYAQYLLDHDVFGHYEDGRDPWQRLEDNPAIGACHDFLSVAENLAAFMTSGNSISLPVERSIYLWMYADISHGWGHRHAVLWYPYDDNGGPSGREGFLGIGRANGPYMGWNYGEVIVMNVFDPCASWSYDDPILTARGYIPYVSKDAGLCQSRRD